MFRLHFFRIFAMMLFFAASFLSSCSKTETPRVLPKPVRENTKEARLKELVYTNTYDMYLWQDQLPTSFPTEDYRRAEDVLEALTEYSRDPVTHVKLDRFSFLDRSGTVEREISEGRKGSFGFDVRYQNETDLYVKMVYPGSPAAEAGMERGFQVLAINGNSELANSLHEPNDYQFLFDALDAESIELRLKKPDNTELSVTLQRKEFQIQPVFFSDIYTVGNKNVGYFVLESFVSTKDDLGRDTELMNKLNEIFNLFQANQVEEVIVDLRYNGGGAVITAEDLSNFLAPTSVSENALMYSYGINETLRKEDEERDENDRFFSPVHFNKTNTLNPTKVYFLITEGTASASELLINNLKPYTDVKLIGEGVTYGKPVGFYAVSIMNNDLYAVSFKTINADGETDYYEGMPVDKDVTEDLRWNWGDVNDPLLREALHYAESGSFTSEMILRRSQTDAATDKAGLNRKLDLRGNKDMYYFSLK
ncbi:S41 family peptidase [Albibacterium profundi]|uniref:S41 family peptidase n=1 Tax=Albibacterium profundi TaxID=3134906 RepID=A0ABV5C9U6_9SPHI